MRKTGDSNYSRTIAIDHQWKDTTCMLINMHDDWKNEVENIYLKSDVFKNMEGV
jgi:hypothetical protein